jgi:hypothetical protein
MRKFIDGFESGSSPPDLWDSEASATVISSAGLDMDGDYCLDLNPITAYLQKDVTADDEMYFAVLWRPTQETNSEAMLAVFKGTTVLVHIACSGGLATSIKAYRGAGTGNVIGTGTKTFSINTTYLIEVRIKIADAPNGIVQVKVDGISDIDVTNGDTKPGADTQFDKVYLGYSDQVPVYSCAYFDNFIMDDAAWIGDTNIQAIVPTSAGNSTNWAPSAGSNFACVDEIPPSDADYVSINANSVVDSYTVADLSGSINNVKCVQVQARARTEGAPTPTQLQLVVRRSGTDYFSASKSVPSSEASLSHLWATDPSTSVAWLEAGVNAAELGIKSIA